MTGPDLVPGGMYCVSKKKWDPTNVCTPINSVLKVVIILIFK